MAVFIEANYSKKIGLPAYSSHSFSVTVRSEVSDFSEIERESSKLYSILQNAVDAQIVQSGYTPDGNGNGQTSSTPRSTNGHTEHQSNGEAWACSDKQRDLIKKIVDEHKLDKQEVEALSKDMFNAPVKALNKMDASSLIAELISKYGPTKSNGGNGNGRRQYQRGGAR